MLLLVSLLTACDGNTEQAGPPTSERPVRTAEVRSESPRNGLRLPAETRPAERMQLAFLHAGYVAERKVARGERVRTGQVLAVLHNPGLAPAVAAGAARVRELDAHLEQAEKELARIEDLYRRGVSAEDDLDRARTQRNATAQTRQQAEADLDQARRQLAEANLRAPTDGRIAELLVEPGDFVAAGQPVLVLQGDDSLEIAVDLPERAAHRLNPGDPVNIIAWQNGETATGRVREIGRAANGRPAPAVIDLDARTALKNVASGCQTVAAGAQEPECTNRVHEDSEHHRTPSDARAVVIESGSGWLPGQAVHVYLEWPEADVLLVPLTALGDLGNGRVRVFRVRDGRAEAVPVETGRLYDGRVEVRGELAAGDIVVTAGRAGLLDGEKVRVLP